MLPREHYLKQSFQDAVNFPEGFEKGGLTDIQARLVRKNGILINALIVDEVSDPTSDDLHILKVIANQSAPKSPVEQAWAKYITLVKAKSSDSKPAKKTAKAKADTKTEPAKAKVDAVKTEPKTKAATAEKPKKTTKKASEKA